MLQDYRVTSYRLTQGNRFHLADDFYLANDFYLADHFYLAGPNKNTSHAYFARGGEGRRACVRVPARVARLMTDTYARSHMDSSKYKCPQH